MLAGKPAPYSVFKATLADAEALLRHGYAPDRRRDPNAGRDRCACGAPRTQFFQRLRLGPLRLPFPWAAPTIVPDHHDRANRPFLRQSLVVACSAFETYVVDKAIERAAARIVAGELPHATSAAAGVPTGPGAGREHRWGGPAIDAYVQATRRVSAERIGHIFASVGVEEWTSRVDESRRVPEGTTARELGELTRSLNQIVRPSGGYGRRGEVPDLEGVARHLQSVASIVEALEPLLSSRDVPQGKARL